MADLEEEIFGADSDDDIFNDRKEAGTSSPREKVAEVQVQREDDEDDLFKDSDDEGAGKSDGKLRRLGSASKKKLADDHLVDSDDEENTGKRKMKQKKMKKRKREEDRRSSSKKEKRLKTKERSQEGDDDANQVSSGDEYDSGEEVKETQEDRDFIDEDDDLADVRNEYDEDNQNFDDERPEKEMKKKSKGKSSASSALAAAAAGGGGGYVPKTKDLDPLSQTLLEIRKPKVKDLSDAEKDQMVEKLLKKMAQAVELDDECFRKKEPAVHKLALLPTVQRAVAMKSLHLTLLDKDFLCYLRDWIEPKNANTLPALSLRTAIYEMLLKLPALTEHLKRGNDKMPIGYTVVALRKHKMETPENKRLLKEVMDKWSRPIFSKTAEGGTGGEGGLLLENEEVKAALVRKYSDNGGAATGGGGGAKTVFRMTGTGEMGLSEKKEADLHNRARAPMSHGYLFTVQPELKNIDKRNVMEKSLGEERMKLFKKMTEGGKSSSTGKKTNPRAMNISVSGNNLKH